MLVIAVTGSIGSGKSTVLNTFKRLNVHTISLDELAQEIMNTNETIKSALVSAFGWKVINQDGTIDKKELASWVFNNHTFLKFMNSVVHPEVHIRLKFVLNDLVIKGAKVVVIESPYPIRSFLNTLDYTYDKKIAYVYKNRLERIMSIMERNGLSCADACKRIHALPDDDSYLIEADHLILNNGTFLELERQVMNLLKIYGIEELNTL